MEIILILLLIVINGFFAMSEISVVSSRRARLESAAQKGSAGAKKAIELLENPSRFLSTVQVGITLIGILTGMFGGDTIAAELENSVRKTPVLAAYSKGISVTVVVILITYFSIVIGELVPKRIGLTMPEAIAKSVSRPMSLLSKIAAPFIWLLSRSTELIIRIFNIKKKEDNYVTEEEIKAIVQEGAEAGSIEEIEQDLVTNILHLSDRTVNSLMTHRHQLVWIDSQKPFESQIEKLLAEELSVFPVCNGTLDRMTGVFHLRDYAKALLLKEDFKLEAWIKKPLFLPENMKAYKALGIFQESKIHFGVIVDEYGSVQGVITLNDLLDEMVGDIIHEEEDEKDIAIREDGSYLVNGSTNINDLMKELDLVDDETEFNTVAGLVLHHAGHIPQSGFLFKWNKYTVEVLDMDGHKIDKVLITREDKQV
ncbi:MAG: HlyC/CorC family transporter [Williamsia sp.]|nr:HlyC/CorC family transporter [Williamsia sp.]